MTLAACVSLSALSAQEGEYLDPAEGVPKAFAAMNAKNWLEAHTLLERIFSGSPDGAEDFGGRWGSLYYNKGYCELNLGRQSRAAGDEEKAAEYFAMAIESFQTCYKTPSDDISPNAYEKKCLFYLAEVKQLSGDYAGAIENYKKFITERKDNRPQDKFDPGQYYVNLTICHLSLEKPDLVKGIEFFQNTLNYRVQGVNISDKAIITCFQRLAEACIKAKNEAALLDFLRDNRGILTLDPYMMYQFTPFFQKLAMQAKEHGMAEAMLAIYTLIPGSEVTQDDIQARQAMLEGYPAEGIKDGINIIPKAQLKTDLDRVRSSLSSGDPHEVYGLLAMADLHEKQGNIRGAFGAYKQLEQYFNKSKFRETSLYSLVRTSSVLGDVFVTERYGRLFEDVFPESKYLSEVRRMMLTALFFEGKYHDCEILATTVLETAENPSKYHDMALHVLAGSKFYLAKYAEAKPLLEEHVKAYPDSLFAVGSRYMEASTLHRLFMITAAAPKFDVFIKDFPTEEENPFLSTALYDRADIHVTEEEYEAALKLVERLETDFMSSSVAERAINLKGNIFLTQDKEAEAEEAFKKALALASDRGNKDVASESLFHLVSLIGPEKKGKEENPRLKEAVPFYDQFWQNHQDSGYKTQLAVVGIPALTKVGRNAEALTNLQSVISEMAKEKNAPGLEKAINSYTKYFLASGKSVEELQQHYLDFPDIDREDRRTKALLRMATIKAYQTALKGAMEVVDEEKITRYSAAIEVSFGKLRKEFDPKELSNFILLSIGEYIRNNMDNPEFAEPYYQQILKNDDRFGRQSAQFGLADIWGQSEDIAKVGKAVTILKEVYATQTEDKKTCEQALYRLIEISVKKDDWKGVQDLTRQYLKPANRPDEAHRKMQFTQNKPKVSFHFATSFDKSGQVEDAIANYSRTYGAYPGRFDISAPATLRGMQLTWKRNGPASKAGKPNDRQIAYEWGAYFIKSSRDSIDANKQTIPEETLAVWETVRELVKKYEGEPGIINLATLKERQRKREPLYPSK